MIDNKDGGGIRVSYVLIEDWWLGGVLVGLVMIEYGWRGLVIFSLIDVGGWERIVRWVVEYSDQESLFNRFIILVRYAGPDG